MGYQAPIPAALKRVEYAKLYFHLEVMDGFDLPPLGLLQLRRELLQVMRSIQGGGDPQTVGSLRQLLQPGLPEDPVLLRQVQKPAPAMVVSPDISMQGRIEPKHRIVLPVLFVGSGIYALGAFVELVHELGRSGLYRGTGRFFLEAVEAENASGLRAMLWMQGEPLDKLTPPVCDLSWWLERQKVITDSLRLELISPLRLMRQGKPLFKAGFQALFPFVLRRVTGMLAGHAGVELVKDPGSLISIANRVDVLDNCLRWKDWRILKGKQGCQGLGGLMGHLSVTGDALSELVWVLQLGSLLNLGKGAAYGCGQYRLRSG